MNVSNAQGILSTVRGVFRTSYGADARATSPVQLALRIIILALVYFAAARFGQLVAIPPGNVTAVWFPSGIALVALLLFGYRLWPGVWLGALFGNTWAFFDPTATDTAIRSAVVGMAIATGASLQALSGAYLIRRVIDSRGPCDKAKSVIKFAAFAGVFACLVSSTVGVTSLSLGRFLDWSRYGTTWLTWWLGDTVGVLLIGPLLLSWYFNPPERRWSGGQLAELTALLVLIAMVGQLAFGSWLADLHGRFTWAYMTIPLLVWPAVRFGQRETMTAAFLLSLVAMWDYRLGYKPLGDLSLSAILSLQGLLGIASVTSLSLAADISHRRRVTRSMAKYRAASLQAADHWMITDLDGVIQEVNRSFENLTGYDKHELVGSKPNILKSGKHNRAFYERMWQTILSGRPYRGIVINCKKNGDLFYEMKTITPIKDDTGKIRQFLSMGKDITELKLQERELIQTTRSLEQANESLRLSEQALSRQVDILQSVFGSMMEGVIVADENGRFVMFNEAAEEMLGIGPTDSSPGTWAATYGLYLPDNRTPFPTEELPLVRAIAGESTDGVEMIVRHPAKPEPTWLRVSGNPIRDEDGVLHGGLVVARDITEQKSAEQAEEQLRASRAELAIATRIQRRFLPEATPYVAGFDVAGASRPAAATGGDYFDYVLMRDGSLVIFVGDVSGHGLGPALLMATVRGHLRALAETGLEPGEILNVTNRLIAHDTDDESFVTFFFARLDPKSRTLDYVSAGHSTAYVLDEQNEIKKKLESTGPPLGVLREFHLQISRGVALEAGDTVLILTDGILEAECKNGSFFGVDRTLDVVRANSGKPAREIVGTLFKQVTECSRSADLEDDITAVVVKVHPVA